jgi:hypothetical protein
MRHVMLNFSASLIKKTLKQIQGDEKKKINGN